MQAAAEWLTEQEDIAACEQAWLQQRNATASIDARPQATAALEKARKKTILAKYAYVRCEEQTDRRKPSAAAKPVPPQAPHGSEAKTQVRTPLTTHPHALRTSGMCRSCDDCSLECHTPKAGCTAVAMQSM